MNPEQDKYTPKYITVKPEKEKKKKKNLKSIQRRKADYFQRSGGENDN